GRRGRGGGRARPPPGPAAGPRRAPRRHPAPRPRRRPASARGGLAPAGRLGHPLHPRRGRPPGGGRGPLLPPAPIPPTRGGPAPRAMGPDDMERVTGQFAAAARLAAAAGVQVLLLDLAHGHLLGGFLSPLANRRDDEFGGTLEGRLRFPLRVVDAVRAAWPTDRPLWAAVTVTDWAPGGLEPEEAIAVSGALAAGGRALLHGTAGQ